MPNAEDLVSFHGEPDHPALRLVFFIPPGDAPLTILVDYYPDYKEFELEFPGTMTLVE